MTKKSTPKGNASKKAKNPAVKRAKAGVKPQQVTGSDIVQLADLRKAAQRAAKAAEKAPQKPVAPKENKAAASAFETLTAPFDLKSFTGFNLFGMEKIMTKQDFKFDQFTTEAASAGREQLEAFMKFQTTFTKGFEEILRTAASLTQSSAEKQAEYTKQLMGAKTINEFSVAQNKIAQASFDEFMASATKLSEMSVKLMNESMAPLNDQMSKGMQKAAKKAA